MTAVSSRYARAFADVIADAKLDPVAVLAQLRSLAGAFNTSRELREVWESPAVPVEQKRKLLDGLAAKAGVTTRQLRNFVALLIDQDRIALLPELAEQLENELNSRSGRIHADIISARELGETQRGALLTELSRLTGKAVLPRYAIDSSLIGGVKERVGSTIYDGSVRGQLQRIRQQLIEN
jgi:F-type H+-transporting ATPase subunit delta